MLPAFFVAHFLVILSLRKGRTLLPWLREANHGAAVLRQRVLWLSVKWVAEIKEARGERCDSVATIAATKWRSAAFIALMVTTPVIQLLPLHPLRWSPMSVEAAYICSVRPPYSHQLGRRQNSYHQHHCHHHYEAATCHHLQDKLYRAGTKLASRPPFSSSRNTPPFTFSLQATSVAMQADGHCLFRSLEHQLRQTA